jgi:ribonucleoside-diphosphate reductase alpha chain
MKISRGWSANALDLVYKRFLPAKNLSIEEWLRKITSRVAEGYPLPERKAVAQRYFTMIQSRNFLPTSAALHNLLIGKGSLSGCIVLPLSSSPQMMIEGDLPKISKVLSSGIGVGMDLSTQPPRLFPDLISGRAYPGPIEIVKAIVLATGGITKYAGVKRAAFMGSLSIQHPDIFSFILMKKNERISDINISVSYDKEFQESLIDLQYMPVKWEGGFGLKLLNVDDLKLMGEQAKQRGVEPPDLEVLDGERVYSHAANRFVGIVRSNEIFFDPSILLDCIAEVAHACGDPGLMNLKAINRDNPTHPRDNNFSASPGIGVIKTTTPCGEQPLLPYEVCHLGSLNLSAFAFKGKFDFPAFKKNVETAVRFMDDLIDTSDNGLEEANLMAKENRKIGLGVMGLADVLAELEMPYGSEESIRFANKLSGELYRTALKTSQALALERGPFKSWKYSRFYFDGELPRRHATLTTIAPTGHISTLANCSSSIEPYYLISYSKDAAGVKEVQHTKILKEKLASIGFSLGRWIEFTKEKNPSYEFDGTLKGLHTDVFKEKSKNAFLDRMKAVFKTAHEIHPRLHLKMAATFQKYIENGISKTVNLPETATVSDVRSLLWDSIMLDLKGVTLFRDKCLKTQALFFNTKSICCPNCQSDQYMKKNECGGYSCSTEKGGCGHEACSI